MQVFFPGDAAPERTVPKENCLYINVWRPKGASMRNLPVMVWIYGGGFVNNLLISPLAKGLFERAIVESGGGRPFFPPRPISGSTASADAMGVRLARHFGIEGRGLRALARLRALPASRLVDGLNMATMGKSPTYVGGPILYDHLYMGEPTAVYARDPQIGNRVPVMIGANNADLGFFPAKSLKWLFARFGPKAAQARAAFDPSGRLTVRQAAWLVGGALLMVEPARAIARTLSARGQPLSAGSHSSDEPAPRCAGSRHSAERDSII